MPWSTQVRNLFPSKRVLDSPQGGGRGSWVMGTLHTCEGPGPPCSSQLMHTLTPLWVWPQTCTCPGIQAGSGGDTPIEYLP